MTFVKDLTQNNVSLLGLAVFRAIRVRKTSQIFVLSKYSFLTSGFLNRSLDNCYQRASRVAKENERKTTLVANRSCGSGCKVGSTVRRVSEGKGLGRAQEALTVNDEEDSLPSAPRRSSTPEVTNARSDQ